MTKRVRDCNAYHNFLSAEKHLLKKIDGPELEKTPQQLAQECNYPLFKIEQVRPNVYRKRAISRG